MQRPLLAAAFLVPACLAFSPRAALAQAKAGSNELDIYGGRLFGQRLTDSPVEGLPDPFPKLADHVTFGARFNHGFTEIWGVEIGAGETQTHTQRRVGPGVSDLRLQTAELDVTYNFTPESRVVGYSLMGAGIARVRLEPDLMGTVNGEPALLAPKRPGAPSANVGLGARAFLTRHLVVRAEVRYRYLGHLLTEDSRSLNTVETTLGLGWRF